MSRLETYKKPRQNKRGISLAVFGLFSILFIIAAIVFWRVYPFPSDQKVDYFSKEHPIIFNQSIYKQQAYVKDNQVLLPYSFVSQFIDPTIHFDQESSSVVITTKDKLYQMPTNHLDYYMNEGTYSLKFPSIVQNNDSIFLSVDWLQKIYPITIVKSDKTGALFVYQDGDVKNKAIVKSTENEDLLRIRTHPKLTSPYVEEVAPNQELIIEKDTGNYFKVRTNDGVGGFLKKDVVKLTDVTIVNINNPNQAIPFQPKLQWPLHITWDLISSAKANPNNLPDLEGVQVVSPTWFSLTDTNGTIENIASKHYVDVAKKNNYQVWGLFSNNFNKDWTKGSLQSFETRQKMIRQLLHYAEIYNLDGINIDFENVYEEDGPLLTQFVRELTPLAHEAGLVVSMDVTFISNSGIWSKFYQRNQLAAVVDYVMVMSYDEHWSTSPVAGSVASLPWVEKNLKRILTQVPNEKLLLGVPFYTRLWKEEKLDNGKIKVTSEAALTMDKAQAWMKERNLKPVYDPNSGQDYVEYKVPNQPITYKMWLETPSSIQKRTDLVKKYHLAGIASWNKYFASKEIWAKIEQNLNSMTVTAPTKTEQE